MGFDIGVYTKLVVLCRMDSIGFQSWGCVLLSWVGRFSMDVVGVGAGPAEVEGGRVC